MYVELRARLQDPDQPADEETRLPLTQLLEDRFKSQESHAVRSRHFSWSALQRLVCAAFRPDHQVDEALPDLWCRLAPDCSLAIVDAVTFRNAIALWDHATSSSGGQDIFRLQLWSPPRNPADQSSHLVVLGARGRPIVLDEPGTVSPRTMSSDREPTPRTDDDSDDDDFQDFDSKNAGDDEEFRPLHLDDSDDDEEFRPLDLNDSDDDEGFRPLHLNDSDQDDLDDLEDVELGHAHDVAFVDAHETGEENDDEHAHPERTTSLNDKRTTSPDDAHAHHRDETEMNITGLLQQVQLPAPVQEDGEADDDFNARWQAYEQWLIATAGDR